MLTLFAAYGAYAMGGLYLAAGLNHFINPRFYLPIMPPWVPRPLLAQYVAGFFEMAFGAGVLFAATRSPAAWGLILLLVAIFPANVYMLQQRRTGRFRKIPEWSLWLRLPLQAVLIAWAWLYT
jgi:uncharacterized membrane protein